MGVDESCQVESFVFSEVGFVQWHRDFQPRSQLDDVCQSCPVVERPSAPDWRILLVTLPILGVTGRTAFRIEFCTALTVGLSDIHFQLRDRVGTGGPFWVHADRLVRGQPSDVRRNGD